MSQAENVKDQVSEEEWNLRVDLAACYRLIAYYGWEDLVFTHISAKVPGPDKHFLINPYGMLFDEITASSLVKVDMECNKVMESPYPVNPAGFIIHSAIHEAREDAHCVLHLHTDCGVAVSCQKEGLLPISQNSIFPYASLAYHNYEGVALNPEEKVRLVNDLGDKIFFILRNHGTLTVGANVPDAFLAMFFLERACKIQVMAQSGGSELIRIAQPILDGALKQAEEGSQGMGGMLPWPGLLRKLDKLDPSFRD